jgi:tetratricopeptide (TPR) repeat protein
MAQRPNPQSIGICALIALYSDPNSLLHELKEEERSTIAASNNRVALFLDESVLGKNDKNKNQIAVHGFPEKETSDALTTWMICVKRRLGTQSAELLIDTLNLASESVDALMDLFESLKGAIQEGLVDATSLHGLYLRRFCLGFDELSFESAILLWQALKERVSIIQQAGLDENIDVEDGAPTSIGHGNSTVWPWPLSTDQMQSILLEDCIGFEMNQGRDNSEDSLSGTVNDHRVKRNASQPPPDRNRAQHSFEQMEIYIRKMLKNDPELPAAHFLRYLNCLRHGERVGALDALHEYFDHSMVKRNVDSSRSMIDGIAGARTSKDILQFSAILLAMTHSSFGDSNLALLATEEAVRVAQQSKDAACVAFALGWLYEHHGQGTAERRELLRRCASRASQGQLRPLVAGAQLTLAKHALRGESSAGGNTLESSITSTTVDERTESTSQEGSWTTSWNHLLQVIAEPTTDNSGALDRPTYLSQNPDDVLQSMALQRLVSAGIWDSLGMPTMGKWASKAALNQEDKLSYEDLLAAIQNISRCALHGSPPTIRKNIGIGRERRRREKQQQDGCDAPSVEKKIGTDIHPSCSYARAVSAMLQLRIELRLEGNDLEEPILHSLALIFHEWAINRGDLDDAMALQTMLDSYLHPGLQNIDQLYADIRMQKYLYYCRIQNWERAREIGTSLVKYCKNKGLLNNQARILIQMAITELEADRKQSTTALSPLLEALALCEKWEMHGLHAVAMSILAQIFLRLQNPKRAIAIIDATLPTLIQREHVWFQAEAYLTLSKAHLKFNANSVANNFTTKRTSSDIRVNAASTTTRIPATDKRRFHNALHGLNKSMHLFEECHDRHRLREVCYLQAQIHSLLSDAKKRDIMSEKYVKLGSARRCSMVNTDHDFSACRLSLLDALSNPLAIQVLVGRPIY